MTTTKVRLSQLKNFKVEKISDENVILINITSPLNIKNNDICHEQK